MASGGVEEKTIDTDICNCTICLDTFKVPKILPCLHTFCESCLNSYILSSKDDKCPSPHFLCPVCRTEVTMSDPEVPSEKWAQLMPLNNMVASLIEGSFTDQEESEMKCTPCERHGESTQGQFWCFECQENLCDFCRKCHQRVKVGSGHKIVPVNELKKEDFGVKLTDVEEPCFEHKDEFLKVYCIDHQKMCCVLCLSTNHRKCENIKTFDQMIEMLKESDGTQNLIDNMNKFGQKMEELIVKKHENVEDLGQQKQDIVEDVAKMIEQAKEKLDNFHVDFKAHLSQTHKEQSTKLVDMKERFEMYQKSIENCKKMLQAVLKYGSSKQIFITSEKIKTRLDFQLRELQELLDTDEVIAYDNNVDKHLENINNSMKTTAVFELKKTLSKESFNPVDRFFRNGYRDALLQRQLKTANICDLEAVKIWDIKQDGDYSDAVFLNNDDELLVADCKTSVLLVYDNEGKLSFSRFVDYKPLGVTQSSDGKILVSDIKSPGIRIYTFEHQKLQQISHLETTQSFRAIDIVQDNILAVQEESVTLLTQDGTRSSRIGQCHQYSFVSTSKTDTRCLYCCDRDCVVKYTLDGNEITRHKLKYIDTPRGVAVDNAENIYVCGRDSHNVLIFSKDGISSRILLSIFKPYSIGFDHTGTKFFLTSYNNGTVTVFRLRLKPRN